MIISRFPELLGGVDRKENQGEESGPLVCKAGSCQGGEWVSAFSWHWGWDTGLKVSSLGMLTGDSAGTGGILGGFLVSWGCRSFPDGVSAMGPLLPWGQPLLVLQLPASTTWPSDMADVSV
jgi:hypothetical protein